jgi:hypothetical protein
MIASLRLDNVRVDLEQKTKLETMQVRFGGKIGAQGDAAESLMWLCLHGNDTTGPWVLWLDSDELDGPYVGGYRWQRAFKSTQFDQRCAALPDTAGVELPISLTLGMSERQVLHTLGPPTFQKSGVLFYEHEHTEMIRGEEFTSSNEVTVALRNGVVWVIDVSKSPLIN